MISRITSPSQLILLSALGGFLLWGVMIFNGTLDALLLVQKSKRFPDGRLVRTTYTGNKFLDNSLIILTSFFDILISSEIQGPQWLLFDLCVTLGAVNTWVLVESRRRGVRNIWLRHTVMFIFLWNTAGAAFITPVYFYFIALSKHTTRDRTIPLNEARGFPLTLVANLLFPLYMFAPKWLGWSNHDRQGYIALYNLTPMFMVFTLVLSSRPGTSLTASATPKDNKKPNEDAPWIIASYYAIAAIASLVHLTIIGCVLSGKAGPGVTITRLFGFSPRYVPQTPTGSCNALLEGAYLFTKFDWTVTTIACVIFVHYLLRKIPDENGSLPATGMVTPLEEKKELIYLSFASLMLGPAGAGSFALAIREKRLRKAMINA